MNQNWWNAAKVGLRGKFIALKYICLQKTGLNFQPMISTFTLRN